MATEEKTKDKKREQENVKKSIIFELEHIALSSREALYEIVKKSLASREKEISIPMFSRYCLDQPLKKFVPELLEAYDISTRSNDKFLKEVEKGMEDFWDSDDVAVRPGFDKFLAKTKDHNFKRIALTTLADEKAAEIVKRLGLEDDDIAICSFEDEDKATAGADIWMSAVVENDLKLGHATAVVSSSKSCKAALTADLNCVVVTDRFTAFEDFGGATVVADSLEKLDVEALISTFYQNEES